jgi:hypothetical protein
MDAGIAYIRDQVMPMLSEMPGCVGLSMMVDRESGRSITTTSWASYDAMTDSAANVSDARAKAAETMGGEAEVDQWEVAVMHREHEAREGSWCRVTWLKADPSEIDTTLDFFKDTVLPALEESEGFCSASLLIDRSTGRCCATARYDSKATLESTREMAAAMRARRTEMGGVEFTEIDECELAVAHLRVPELV